MNTYNYRVGLAVVVMSLLLALLATPISPATAADCEIPPSGPWPACATGGGASAAPSANTSWNSSGNNSNSCVIPPSGPWPACATNGGGGTAAPSAPAAPSGNNGSCVIPTSGPWPACATGGGGGTAAPSAPVIPAIPTPAPEQPPSPEPVDTGTVWTPPVRPDNPTHTLSQLADLPADTRVIVKANVVSTESFSAGYKFTIADNTGRAVLLIWSSVYDDCAQCPFLNIGSEVVVKGVIDSFEGQVQVVPLFGDAVQVTKPAAGLPGRPVQIGDLHLYHEQRVKIEATVQRLTQTQYGMEIVVNDGSGEAEVFFWNNNWQRVPDSWRIETGAIIRVAGMVSEYRGFYTVTPALPYDLEIVALAP